MEVQDVLQQARDAIRADRTYATPYEKNGVTIIPASTVRGGGGGGDHEGDSGGGFGVMARPAGAWVIRGDEVTWKAVSHPGRVIAGAELLIALGFLRARRRRRPHRMHRMHRMHRLQRLNRRNRLNRLHRSSHRLHLPRR